MMIMAVMIWVRVMAVIMMMTTMMLLMMTMMTTVVADGRHIMAPATLAMMRMHPIMIGVLDNMFSE